MGKGGDIPEAPDYTPIANMANKASKKSFKLAKKQFKWAKKQQKQNNAVTKSVLAQLQDMMAAQKDAALEDRQRYEDVFLPLQDKYISNVDNFRSDIDGYQGKVDEFSAEVDRLKQEARDYGSEENKRFMMGRAQGAVASSFEAARRNNLQTLESFGLNPSSTRYGALDLGVRTAEAAAKAAAGTEMGLNVDDTSRAMYESALDRELQARGLDASVLGLKQAAQDMDLNMINVGQGFPGQVSQQWGDVMGGGNSAVGNQLNTSQVNRGNRVSMTDFLNSMNQSLGTWTDALSSGFDNQLNAYKAQQESSSGIGSILGTIAGFIPGFKEGGEVPHELSPSGGAVPDDIPAAVSAGEFIFPEEAVRFYGTQKLQKMVDAAIPEPEDA